MNLIQQGLAIQAANLANEAEMDGRIERLKDAISKISEAQREFARNADERCPVCGRLGFSLPCHTCQ
jgi:hypothetical protein